MIVEIALIAAGGAAGAMTQALVVRRFGAVYGGAWLAVLACTLFGALWALSDPKSWLPWAVIDRQPAAPLLYGLLAASAPLSTVLSGDLRVHRHDGRPSTAYVLRGLAVACGMLIVAAAAIMLGYLAVRGGYTLYTRAPRG